MRLPHLIPLLLALATSLAASAAERITLRSGFTIDCLRHETTGDRTRLILPAGDTNYMEVASTSILSIDPTLVLPAPAPARTTAAASIAEHAATARTLSAADLHPILAHAGALHRIDEDLLASIVRAESNGVVHAVSRTGARGLMQLMPQTASDLGVHDSFSPAQNIDGGSAYLDQLLTRYHDNIALAVAAYNAGPSAVDRFHGVPPFRETRAYVARVIREFNRRKLLDVSSRQERNPAEGSTSSLHAGLH